MFLIFEFLKAKNEYLDQKTSASEDEKYRDAVSMVQQYIPMRSYNKGSDKVVFTIDDLLNETEYEVLFQAVNMAFHLDANGNKVALPRGDLSSLLLQHKTKALSTDEIIQQLAYEGNIEKGFDNILDSVAIQNDEKS